MSGERERNARAGGACTRISATCTRTVRPSSGNGSSCGDTALLSDSNALHLSYGSRRRAANAHTRRVYRSVKAPPERGKPTCTASAPEVTDLRGPPPARRKQNRVPAVGVAFLLLERHATPADGGPCPDFPRPSLVKQRSKAKRPTWRMAQVGRVVPLPHPSGVALYGV
jgi:hypothetical protein